MGIKSSIVHVAKTLLLLSSISTSATAAVTQAHGTQQIDVPGFGPVLIFRSPSAPSSIALYLSPAAGWSDWDTTMARQIAKGDTLVAGVETPQFLSHLDDKSGACTDPASSLEALVSSLRRDLAVSDHVQPMIVGHAEGGMLAYDALAEPDHHTFKGGLAMDFLP
jgi:type IV secretory pathway VirJ component